jgi:putative membrane-bound dehydrogenase-like protein
MNETMSRFARVLGCLTFLCVWPGAESILAQSTEGFEPIFDGRTLQGWRGDRSHWRVEEGAIVGEIPPGQTLRRNTWLIWDAGELADFDLRLQCRLSGAPAANSGIQFRCQAESPQHVSGYQADLDQGATWLGRIYDEHGRALLVERGSRVLIAEDGSRHVETFAPVDQYAVLFREHAWNDYRIVCSGEHMSVYVNGTLFSQLVDRHTGQRDLSGKLALQLHSGPETKVEFRDIRLRRLPAGETHPVTFSSVGSSSDETHETPDAAGTAEAAMRSTRNPLLHHLVANGDPARAKTSAERTIAQMYVPPGFSVDVIAAEPRLHQPIAFTFDERGRLWVVEGHSYPQKRPPGEGLDRILIFADEDGDGSFESRKVFIEGLNLVSGLEVGYGGVWVGAAPEFLFLPDRNRDDVPDSDPQVLLDGFGYADTHETLNSFVWGPDGWLYGNQGVFNRSHVGQPGTSDEERTYLGPGVWRYHPVRHTFEVFAHGGSNQWGLDYDEHGQLFMTHCRSHFGEGPTTHVIQGAHYWNQVNAGYAPFISARPAAGLPFLRNYMLASAKYGHGEGGAGKPGSRAVYGGHAHVGTMIYLGDNWPAEYRNHLFTHNLHGHQINHQVNRRETGGYHTVHAGSDMFFCADPQYVGVELAYGPDGAVYFSDWYDPRHCHNPNIEQWDRGNGRLYRMQYDATFQPRLVDMTRYTDQQLVDAQLHPNDWHVRTARRILHERMLDGRLSADVIARLTTMALEHEDADRRLRALWAVHAVQGVATALFGQLLDDDSEYVRGWAVQLAVESLPADDDDLTEALLRLAANEPSLMVRRYLAAAIQRVPRELAWQLVETLSQRTDDEVDRNLELMIWFGLARLMSADLERAFRLAATSQLGHLQEYIYWYAARLSDDGRNRLTRLIENTDGEVRADLLVLFQSGISGQRGLHEPEGWAHIAARLYELPDDRARRAAESLGAAFGDQNLFARIRPLLSSAESTLEDKRHALTLLSEDDNPANLPAFVSALETGELRLRAIPLLAQFADQAVGERLVAGLPVWSEKERTAAMNVLTSREMWANQLLDAIAAERVERQQLNAFDVRQLVNLGSESLTKRLEAEWGVVGQSSAERQQEIARMVDAFTEAPLWAFSHQNGQLHFKKLCASCHQPENQTQNLGPQLTGSGSKGIRYFVENVIDPNAVIGQDFQARLAVMSDGRVISGLIVEETESAVTLRTTTEPVTIAKKDIEEIIVSRNSFMPEGLLKPLSDREQIELFKFLMSL